MTVITFPFSYVSIFLGLALGFFVLGIFLLKKTRPGAVGLFLFGLYFGAVVVPSTLASELIITQEGIQYRGDLFFNQREYGIEYSDTASIRITQEWHWTRRTKEDIWYITDKSGNTRKIKLGDLWKNNSDLIVHKCLENGIEVIRES